MSPPNIGRYDRLILPQGVFCFSAESPLRDREIVQSEGMIGVAFENLFEASLSCLVIANFHALIIDKIRFEVHSIDLIRDVFGVQTRGTDDVLGHIDLADAKIPGVDPAIFQTDLEQFGTP